ncbi:MAG: TRAP transporter small permease [Bdellovibrionales bacterium]|nr:TRAP transporter small permease [Bdellovibrionales bacterium]
MKLIQTIDQKLYSFEKRAVGWLFVAMSAVVFVDVVHRIFSRSPGRLSVILSGPLKTSAEELEKGMPLFLSLILFVLCFGALKTRNSSKAVKKSASKKKLGRLLGEALALEVALILVVGLFVKFMPSGLIWSPYFGLSCLLWVGLLGASMATYTGQHLQMEMGEKLWPKNLRPHVAVVQGWVVGIFCAIIAILGKLSVLDHFMDWRSGPGAGLIPSIDWPKWLVYSVIPYSFAVMAFRFIGRAMGWTKKVQVDAIDAMAGTATVEDGA